MTDELADKTEWAAKNCSIKVVYSVTKMLVCERRNSHDKTERNHHIQYNTVKCCSL